MPNNFVHMELNTTDVDKSKDFYGKLFDWTLADTDMGGGFTYTMIRTGDSNIGGIMKHPMPGAPSVWIGYVLVEDIEAATAKAKFLGGTIIKEVSEVPGAGWFSIILDPTGTAIGLWKAMPRG